MSAITRRGAMLGATAAVAVGTGAAPAARAADPEEGQVLALFRQLNSVRQETSLTMMRALLDVQRHNERHGWAEEPPESAYPWRAPK